MVRPLILPWAGSNFSQWHRDNMPHSRTLSHICRAGELPEFQPPRLVIVQNNSSFKGDKATDLVEEFACRIHAIYYLDEKRKRDFDCRRFPDFRHRVWIAKEKKSGSFILFAVVGNRSDLRANADDTLEDNLFNFIHDEGEALRSLFRRAQHYGFHPRVIRVDREGKPESQDDCLWLWTMGRNVR